MGTFLVSLLVFYITDGVEWKMSTVKFLLFKNKFKKIFLRLWRAKETYMFVPTSHFLWNRNFYRSLLPMPGLLASELPWTLQERWGCSRVLPPLVWWSFWGSERRSSPCMADTLTHLSPQPTCLVLGKIVVKLAHGASSLTVPRRIKQDLLGGPTAHGLPRSCLWCALDLSLPIEPEQITFSCVFVRQFSRVLALPAL